MNCIFQKSSKNNHHYCIDFTAPNRENRFVAPLLHSTIDTAIVNLLDFSSDTYESLLYQMPEKQKEVFVAIVAEGNVKNISGSTFVKKHKLTSASSVLSAVKGLLEKDFITQERNVYSVYDKFFALWMKRGKMI